MTDVTETAQSTTPLGKIVAWSKNLPEWQQDALRRIIESGDVDGDEIQELVQLCLVENKIDVEGDWVAKPIADGAIPTSSGNSHAVSLASISDVENANALDSKQQLTFGAQGLTVVFGNNGSGKSGYGRIFRRACRSRSKGTAILPNVMATSDGSPATAVISYRFDDTEQSPEQWIDGQRAVDALGAVSFFDADCALEHVRSKNDIAFTPFGLDSLPKLGAACKKVQAKLDEMRSKLQSATPKFLQSAHARGDHAVGKFLRQLSADSNTTDLDALAAMSPAETKRLEELPRLLGADPAREATALRKRSKSIAELQQTIGNVNAKLTSHRVKSLQKLANDAAAKKEAASQAAAQDFANDPLPGIGGAAWKHLWEAAKQYSQEAYPGTKYPVVGEGSSCVLCQQELDSDAKDRLQRFESYVADKTAASAQSSAETFSKAIQQYETLELDSEKSKLQLEDLKEHYPAEFEELSVQIGSLRQRNKDVLDAISTGNWPVEGELSLADIASKLSAIREAIVKQAEAFETSSTSQKRDDLKRELDLLRAREWLSTVAMDIRAELLRKVRISQLDVCITGTKTNRITMMSKQLAKDYVTDQLRNAFADEIKKMHQGTRRLNVELAATAGAFGSSNYRVQLVGASDSDIGMVVSEGEHRCIALAGFLSELTTENSKSAIIFDDPVTSLDHNWRDCFASRLLEEAENRQVIVFTHDIVFLHDLLTGADRAQVPCHIRCLNSNARASGLVSEDLPWIGKKVKERIDELEKATRLAKRLYDEHQDDDYGRDIRLVYGRLRATVERTVEEVVFRGVVIRHRDYVNVSNLKPVAALEMSDCDELMNLFQKCCDVTEAHDRAAAKGFGVPKPEDALTDIDELKRIVTDLKAKQKPLC